MKQPYIKIILTIFIASLLFYAVFITFNYYNKNLANVEKFGPSSIPDVTVALFYADWCGHCKKYKESKVFDETSKKINADPTLNGKIDNPLTLLTISEYAGFNGESGLCTLNTVLSNLFVYDEITSLMLGIQQNGFIITCDSENGNLWMGSVGSYSDYICNMSNQCLT